MSNRGSAAALVRATGGMVFVEFLVVVELLILLVFGIAQSLLLDVAQLAVLRASNASVRAASVVLDDDPRHYGGDGRNAAPPGSARHAAIKRAATIVLSAVIPPNRSAGIHSVLEAISSPDQGQAIGALLAPSAVLDELVEVDVTADPQSVSVRVTLRYPCVVPVARALFCVEGTAGHERLITASARLPNHAAPSVDYGAGQ